MSVRSLSGITMQVKMAASLNNLLGDGVTSASVTIPSVSYKPPLKNGAGPNMANAAHQLSGTLLAGATLSIDLWNFAGVDIGNGLGKDAVGLNIRFEKIVAIIVKNENIISSPAVLEVYPAVSHGWEAIGSHTVATGGALRAQGMLLKANPHEYGLEVGVSDTNDQITIHAVGGAVAYTIAIIGSTEITSSSSSSHGRP